MPSFPPDPADMDDKDDRPRPLFNTAFWIALVFGLACVLAGLAVGLFGSRLFVT